MLWSCDTLAPLSNDSTFFLQTWKFAESNQRITFLRAPSFIPGSNFKYSKSIASVLLSALAFPISKSNCVIGTTSSGSRYKSNREVYGVTA